MHLHRATIQNLRSIRRADWHAGEKHVAGWHVVLGENASGKTTFLRAVARALLGFPGAQPELDPNDWCRAGAPCGGAELILRGHAGFDKGELDPNEDEVATFSVDENGEINFPHLSRARAYTPPPAGVADGWLSLGYGPYRRFSGGEARLEKYASPAHSRVEGHLTLFNEGAVLPEGALWMSKLGWRQAEEQRGKPSRNGKGHGAKGGAAGLMRHVTKLLRQPGLLPPAVKFDSVTPDGIFFAVGSGHRRSLLQLSDGYKSILSIVFDVLRNMERAYGGENVFDEEGHVMAPAVVLIDEIDIHLHPTWQQRIGQALKRVFPNIQFIVTTHSPIVCQEADSVMVLRKGVGEQLTGIELDRMRYGNVLDAFSTGVFGEDVARSKQSAKMLKRLAELNRRSFRGEELTEKERRDQARLRKIMLTMDMDRPGEAS